MELRLPASSYLGVPTPGRHCNSFLLLPLRKKLTRGRPQLHDYKLPRIASTHGKRSFLESSTPPNPNVIVRARTTEEVAASEPTFQRLVKFLDASWRFLRPYTTGGLIVASMSWGIRAFLEKPKGVPLGLSLLQALSAVFVLICANGFAAGINQIYDVDIDKINKPYQTIFCQILSSDSHMSLNFKKIPKLPL